MAIKNHSLDSQIAEAAFQEFLTFGYEKASLRKIAANAGVTVGAIYTRYATKDSLFCSLVQPLIDRISEAFSQIQQQFFGGSAGTELTSLESSMQIESQAILHLLFDDYERAVLLLCRSAGSSLEHYFDAILQRKIDTTIQFFHGAGVPHPGPDVLRLLLKSQFSMYFQIVDGGYDLNAAKRMMQAAITYHTGGWIALLNAQTTDETGGTP